MSAAELIEFPRLTTRDGACAEIIDDGDREIVAVKDRRGRVIFEYDADSGTGSLIMPEGDLSLLAPNGAIDLIAAEGIRCVSGGEIALRSRSRASIGVGASVLGADSQGVSLHGDRLAVDAGDAALSLERASYQGSELDADVSLARLTLGKLESVAEQVVSRATNVFQHVQDLHQLKAGRLRALVRDALSLKGRDVSLKAQQDVRIDGEHINLG